MKIKFNLGWILAIGAALALAAMAFLSVYYRTGGNLVASSIAAACMLVLPVVAVAFMLPAKECSRPFYFHKMALREALLLVAVFVLLVGSLFLVNHFFTVNSRVNDIATAVDKQQSQVADMKKDYCKHVDNRLKARRINLEDVVRDKDNDPETYNHFFPEGGDDVNRKVMALNEHIKIDTVADSAGQPKHFDKVGWLQLPSVMNEANSLSAVLDHNYNTLTKRDSNDTDFMKPDDFWTYEYQNCGDIMAYFKETDGNVSSPWTVISVILAYLLILLPYFTAERDSRSKGLLAELKKGEDNDEDDDEGYSSGNIGRL